MTVLVGGSEQGGAEKGGSMRVGRTRDWIGVEERREGKGPSACALSRANK